MSLWPIYLSGDGSVKFHLFGYCYNSVKVTGLRILNLTCPLLPVAAFEITDKNNAGRMTQLVKNSMHEDLNWITRTQVKRQGMVVCASKPILGRWRQLETLELTGQPV